ncbi:MAG: hypothetical protein ACP5M0_02310 [Desulfomonilaceae bacterium]
MLSTDETRREETSYKPRQTVGWTQLHSWVFIIIVALGVGVIAMQNRYHYLSPLGLGKAYRIDKLFGGIQEFDPSAGWITAQLAVPPPSPALSMMEPPGPPVASRAVPMNMPAPATPTEVPTPAHPTEKGFQEQPAAPGTPPPAPPEQTVSQPAAKETPELSNEEKFQKFQKLFPQFGQEEFQLANDDLYPDWKANVSKSGTWDQFLTVYRDFVQWWLDAGSPPEPGFKLWKEFLASRRPAEK